MIKYSIIIPSFKAEDYTLKCIRAIEKYTSDYEIILIAQEADLNKFRDLPITIINNPKNLGLGRGANQGFKIARGSIWIVMANDVEVKRGWLKHFEKELKDDVAMVLSRLDMSVQVYDPDFIKTWGGYDENFFFEYEDVEMQKRVFVAKKKCVEIEEMPFIHHLGKSGAFLKDRVWHKEQSRNYMNQKYRGWETNQ